MGLKKGDVAIAGRIGDDVFGDFIEDYLKSKHVVAFLQRSRTSETSKSFVQVVVGQDRRATVEPGANEELSFEFVESKIFENKPYFFYNAGGILGEYDLKTCSIFRASCKAGSLNVFDFLEPCEKDWSYAIKALAFTDIIHCNDVELKLMTGKDDLVGGALKMAELGAKLIIITLGDRGLYAYFKKDRLWIKQDAFKVDLTDPTGAGDALVAGIIFKLLNQGVGKRKDFDDLNSGNIVEALLYGQASGAACVTEIGTTPGVTEKNIHRILSEQGKDVLNSTVIKTI
jgi:fructokinase